MRVCVWQLALLLGFAFLVFGKEFPEVDTFVSQRPTSQLLWPKAVKVESGGTTVQLVPDLLTITLGTEHPIVERAILRYCSQYFFPFPTKLSQFRDLSDKPVLRKLSIHIEAPHVNATLGKDDEQYELEILMDEKNPLRAEATLYAATYLSALRGLETFSQLIQIIGTPYFEVNDSTPPYEYIIADLPLLIQDSAAFKWRGVTLDTARHFSSVDELKTIIDTMSWTKMNVLHWHMTDNEAFSFASQAVPALKRGALSTVATYNYEEIQDLVEFATDRGVYIVPELDIPAHVASWTKGDLNVTVNCGEGVQLDIASEETYQVLHSVFEEMDALFPDVPFHLGGNDINPSCWSQLSNSEFWTTHPIDNPQSLQSLARFFYTEILNILSDLGRDAIIWEDVIDSNIELPSEKIIIQFEKSEAQFSKSLQDHRSILSVNSDIGREWEGENSIKQYEENQNTLRQSHGKENALGGEILFWGDKADDGVRNVFLWPFAADVAADLWVTNLSRDYEVETMNTWLCRAQRRGTPTEEVGPGMCGTRADNLEWTVSFEKIYSDAGINFKMIGSDNAPQEATKSPEEEPSSSPSPSLSVAPSPVPSPSSSPAALPSPTPSPFVLDSDSGYIPLLSTVEEEHNSQTEGHVIKSSIELLTFSEKTGESNTLKDSVSENEEDGHLLVGADIYKKAKSRATSYTAWAGILAIGCVMGIAIVRRFMGLNYTKWAAAGVISFVVFAVIFVAV